MFAHAAENCLVTSCADTNADGHVPQYDDRKVGCCCSIETRNANQDRTAAFSCLVACKRPTGRILNKSTV